MFNYVQFEPVNWHKDDGTAIQLTNAGSILKIVETGPDKKYPKLNGDDGYPTRKSHRQASDEFKDLSEGFKSGLESLIEKIKDKANPILKNKLGYNISFHLELTIDVEQKLTIANYTAPEYKIKLIIDDFEGNGAVLKPQSFLNEARLSAIALSIRLAILEESGLTLKDPENTIKIGRVFQKHFQERCFSSKYYSYILFYHTGGSQHQRPSRYYYYL